MDTDTDTGLDDATRAAIERFRTTPGRSAFTAAVAWVALTASVPPYIMTALTPDEDTRIRSFDRQSAIEMCRRWIAESGELDIGEPLPLSAHLAALPSGWSWRAPRMVAGRIVVLCHDKTRTCFWLQGLPPTASTLDTLEQQAHDPAYTGKCLRIEPQRVRVEGDPFILQVLDGKRPREALGRFPVAAGSLDDDLVRGLSAKLKQAREGMFPHETATKTRQPPAILTDGDCAILWSRVVALEKAPSGSAYLLVTTLDTPAGRPLQIRGEFDALLAEWQRFRASCDRSGARGGRS